VSPRRPIAVSPCRRVAHTRPLRATRPVVYVVPAMKLRHEYQAQDKLDKALIALGALTAGGFLLSRLLNYHPRPVETMRAYNCGAPPVLSPGQTVKVVTYNTQFFAGTGYNFFYEGGPDTLVDPEDVYSNISRFAKFIADECPDLILLQEVDSGARRTAYLDEVSLLRDSLPLDLRNFVTADYWRSKFVPHPKIWGPAWTKLVIFSKYRLGAARRYSLPLRPGNPIVNDFNLKRAILEVEIPCGDGGVLAVLNTHLDAFPNGTDVMERQVSKLSRFLTHLDEQKRPWIIGGDFNLLPPGQRARLPVETRVAYAEPSAITQIYRSYQGVPTIHDATAREMDQFFTFTRRSDFKRIPSRTLDYLFTAPSISVEKYGVRQNGMLELSDHLPVVAEVRFPG
jgi:endonuclease/exonuclease/phosphatase family metal-dependent hydrolase